MLHEAIGTVVKSQAEYAHIVSVKHPVAESSCLPLSHKFGCPHCDLLKKCHILWVLRLKGRGGIPILGLNVWVEVLDQVVQHARHHLVLQANTRAFTTHAKLFVQENLERAEPHEGRGYTHHDRAFLVCNVTVVELVTLDFLV